jgi:hypothetical protein
MEKFRIGFIVFYMPFLGDIAAFIFIHGFLFSKIQTVRVYRPFLLGFVFNFEWLLDWWYH